MYRYIYISTVHLSEEESANLVARIQNKDKAYARNLDGYIFYVTPRDTHFFVEVGGLHPNLDDHLKVNTYQEYIQYVFENQLEK